MKRKTIIENLKHNLHGCRLRKEDLLRCHTLTMGRDKSWELGIEEGMERAYQAALWMLELDASER